MRTMEAIVYFKPGFVNSKMRPLTLEYGDIYYHHWWSISHDSLLNVVGQNANRTKCQPDIMPTKGWHFVRTYFCGWHFVHPNFLVGILSGPSQHVLAVWPSH